MAELTELGRAANLDAETVSYCLALLEFRAVSDHRLSHSPKRTALQEAARDMRAMLLMPEQQL